MNKEVKIRGLELGLWRIELGALGHELVIDDGEYVHPFTREEARQLGLVMMHFAESGKLMQKDALAEKLNNMEEK